jgi:hypothetical protein
MDKPQKRNKRKKRKHEMHEQRKKKVYAAISTRLVPQTHQLRHKTCY